MAKRISSIIEEVGLGLRPQIEVDLVPTATNLKLPNRDRMLHHIFVRDGQEIYLEETKETFQYSRTRNLWILCKKD